MIKKIKSGVGEMLGFAISAPLLLLIMLAIISVMQITLSEQQLAYNAYSVGRAVATSPRQEEAIMRANAVMRNSYGDNFVNGESNVNGNTWYSISALSENATWKKGEFIEVCVYQYVKPYLPFTEGVRARSIVMMIENQIPFRGGKLD